MSDNGHILVVDDQREICDVVQDYLSGEGYRVSIAHDGAGMRRVFSQSPVDLVILDLMLPGEDGLTLARSLRDEFDVGIIILTGRGETVDRIIGLEMGADDYLPKPFHLRELLARVKSVLRRVSSRTGGPAPAPRVEGAVCRLEPRSFQPRAAFAGGQGGSADHRRIRPAGGLCQQCQSGADPRPAVGFGAQSRGRPVRPHDRRSGRSASPQARGRSAKADDDQDGARYRLHFYPDRRDELRGRPIPSNSRAPPSRPSPHGRPEATTSPRCMTR